MTTPSPVTWAYIFAHPGTDPAKDRFVLEGAGQRTILVAVPDEAKAADIAVELVDSGAELIELCGGFTGQDAARVMAAVDGRVPVGHVSFAAESLPGAAAVAARFADAAGGAG